MSLTIQDCASQTAAERRERRRQRILENAEQRLTAILAGPEGTEKRQAPSIEGIFGGDDDEGGKKASSLAGGRAVDGGKEVSFVQDEIQFVAPVYCELVDRHRFWLMILLGAAFRLAVQLGWLDYIVPAFVGLFFGWELLVAVPQKRLLRKYPKHGYLVNTLLIAGLNERLVAWFGIALDLLWELALDLFLVSFSFSCTHALVLVAESFASASPCCSSSST